MSDKGNIKNLPHVSKKSMSIVLNLVEMSIGQHMYDVWIAGSVNICVYFHVIIPGMSLDISDKCIVIE